MTEQRIAELEAMSERGTIRRGHIEEMLVELRRMHEEVTEQARLLGISAERELALLARIDRLERLNAEMLEAIRAFANESDWAAASWKKQPHIAPLFKIAKENT